MEKMGFSVSLTEIMADLWAHVEVLVSGAAKEEILQWGNQLGLKHQQMTYSS